MNISIFNNYRDFFLDMNLVWYHNGSRIADNDRIKISNNGTSLTILNAADSDAGQYEVKIDSMVFTGTNSMECDGNFLPLLENMAINAPATFILQQNSLSIYNPDSIIENYFISPYDGESQKTITVSKTIVVENSTVLESVWYGGYEIRNGNYFSNYRMHVSFNRENVTVTRTISYNNSQDIIGDYEILINIKTYFSFAQCRGYYNYITSLAISHMALIYHYWTIATKCKLKHLSLNNRNPPVFFPSASPPVITSTKPMPVLLGDYLTLTCANESLNDNTVDWFHNDTILSTTTTSSLVLPAVLSHNLGLYTCRRRSDNSSSQPFHVFSRGKKYFYLIEAHCN